MPELLTETFGLYAPLILQLVRITGLIVTACVVFRLVDSALKRVPLVVPLGDPDQTARMEQRAETLRRVTRSAAKIVVFVTLGLVVKTPPTKQWDVVREWRRRFKEEFDRQGIEVPQRVSMFMELQDRKEEKKGEFR